MCLSDECDEGDEYHDEARRASLAGISSMQRSHSEKAKLPSLMKRRSAGQRIRSVLYKVMIIMRSVLYKVMMIMRPGERPIIRTDNPSSHNSPPASYLRLPN